MKKIRIAQIGAAHDHAAMIMNSIRKLSDIFEVVGYCDPEEDEVEVDAETGQRYVAGYPVPEGRSELSYQNYEGVKKYTLEELLAMDDLDAVTVETSETNLFKYAQPFAEKGIHVHMDKPGGLEYADFEKLVNTFKETGKVLHLGYMYRYNPEYLKLLEDIDAGKYGEIYSVECHMDCCHPLRKRDWLKKYKGGMMFFLGCHLVDIIYRIQGEPLEVLPMNCATETCGSAAEDYGFAVFKYPHGVSFAKTCAAEPGGFLRRQLVICGTKGTVIFEPFEGYTKEVGSSSLMTTVRVVDEDLFNWGNNGKWYDSEPFDRYDPMMESFAQLVRGEKENPYTMDYELKLYQLLLKACGR